MSGTLTILASLVLSSVSAEELKDIDDESTRFANVLVKSYSCDLLDYGVDYQGLADWGFDIRDRFVDAGFEPDAAMGRIRADIRIVRGRFNSAYLSTIRPNRLLPALEVNVGEPGLGGFIHVFTERCDELAEQEKTAAFFRKPEQSLSVGDLYKKLRDMRTRARSGVAMLP